MNSKQKSVGKNFLSGALVLVTAVGLAACGSRPKSESAEGSASSQVREQLEGEISLKADRSQLDDLRKEVPEQRKQANDEQALMLQLMGEVKIKPSTVQERYQALVRKRRDVFHGKVQKLRENFKQQEAKKKDSFLSEQKKEREQFLRGKPARDKVKAFFDEQDVKRRDFFASAQEQRKDFETEIQTQSKDFDSYMREKTNAFNEQFRLYSKRYHELEKEKALEAKSKASPGAGAAKAAATPAEAKGAPGADAKPDMSEFEEMNDKPAEPLAPQGKESK